MNKGRSVERPFFCGKFIMGIMGVIGVIGIMGIISIIKGCPIIPIIILTKKGADRCGQHPNYFSGISLLKSKLYNKSYFNPPQGWLFLLAARQRVQALSALAPQRRLKLVAVRESGAYLAYVSILRTSQMPK